MSHAQGINTNFNKILGLVLSNGLVALSGALLAQYQGFADINMGRGAIVIGLAAVIIGDAIFSHISINFGVRLAGVAAGGVIYYIVYQVVVAIGLDPELLKMLSALVVTIFLAIPYVKKKYFSYTPQFKAERKIRKVNAKLAKKQAQLAKKAHDKGGKA
jgi:putative ABC transport system permease protein